MLSTKALSKMALCGVFVALVFGIDSLQSHSIGASSSVPACKLSLDEMETLYRVGSISKHSGNCHVSSN